MKIFFTIFLSIFFLVNDCYSKDLQEKFQDWSVFKTKKKDKTICYIASIPIKKEGNYTKRGDAYFLVNNIINDADEITVSSGFFYQEESNVEISFGSKKFYLFPHLTLAWANDKNDDIDIIKQMQKSEEMIVSGIAKNGKVVNDTYSLIGFVPAYSKMKEICSEIKE
ncbi:MAG: hypothetical protein FJ368_00955 [Pelagibacterales bacterium]|nr:hypothetical protein [Pelagibacterales bacterium]